MMNITAQRSHLRYEIAHGQIRVWGAEMLIDVTMASRGLINSLIISSYCDYGRSDESKFVYADLGYPVAQTG